MQTQLTQRTSVRPARHNARTVQHVFVAPTARRTVMFATVTESGDQQTGSSGKVCSTCGVDNSKIPGGCDGEGRVVGGLGAVPGFGWWPIKAYRPCPALSEAGIEYVRKGQATNEVLFGGVSLGADAQKTLKEIQRQADRGLDVTQQERRK